MKIAYDIEGRIQVVALDTEEVVGDFVATVQDNLDVFTHPAKYRYMDGVFVLSPRVSLTAEAHATVGSVVTVSVRATGMGGVVDDFTGVAVIQHETGIVTPEEVQMVNGVGEFNVTALEAGSVFLFPAIAGMYAEPLIVQFAD